MHLQLVKSSNFGSVQCDFYRRDDEEVCMTTEQLGMALGYATPRESINKIVQRNDYLRTSEFSGEVKMTSPGGEQITRVFTEDGIYEVTMLSRTDKAREFRAFVRGVLKSIRRGELHTTDITAAMAERVVQGIVNRLTTGEVIALLEAKISGSERYDIVKHEPLTGQRRHSKVDQCREMVDNLLINGHTYEEIAGLLKLQGIDISRAAVGRYGKRFLSAHSRSEIKMPTGVKVVEFKR